MKIRRAIDRAAALIITGLVATSPAHAQEAIISNGGATDEARLISHTLTEACSGGRGEINWNDVIRADVNDDGLEDIVIDHIKIRCFGDTGGMSVFCGVGGNCNVTIHTRDEYGWRIK